MKVGRFRKQARDSGLAGTRRPPKDKRTKGARCEKARERAVRAEQVVLTDDLVELCRPQLVGERARRIALEPCCREQGGAAALGAGRHPRSSTDICCPPRRMVMRQTRLC